ncbi:diguanylate cyclase [Shewanella sp. FJAT-52076]|uniref:diguanylate cyclase n=1 Tax=Shewanella sp. FJAT-52076 TaxID=2864202 RepID=UPI001C657DB0|nr:diguanylate cyclase [Shewanella sp. FJAT-52076]QYJ74634.1 sensor domain-containing diguanylate cyclase [Shewanella sp. FJAT-52076]
MIRFLFILLACLPAFSGALYAASSQVESHTPSAQPPGVAEAGPALLPLTPYLSLLEDPKGQLSFDEVRQATTQHQFTPLKGSANFGFSPSTWWIRVSVHNPAAEARHFYLRQDYPLIDFLDLWQPTAEGWLHTATGDRHEFHSRALDLRTFVFPLTLAPGETQTLYLRFETQGSLNIGLALYAPSELISQVTWEYLSLGIYYGGFIVLLVYNLIIFLTVRERAFIFYVLYVLSYGLYMSVHNGLSFQYLWPESSWMANKSLLLLLALSLFGALRFTREILSLAQLLPVADRLAARVEWGCVLGLILAPILSYHHVVLMLSVLTTFICIQLLVVGVMALMKGSRPARFYLVAFSALLLGAFVYMLKSFGVLPHNAFTQNAFQLGSLVEMVLLSLALGSRMQDIKRRNHIDVLTGLYNRRFFDEQLQQEYLKACRRHQPLSLLVLDIDYFKQFNDSRGHAEGDKALQLVADILAGTVQKPGMACRYGGEEFALILPETSAGEAMQLAERIREKVVRDTKEGVGLTVSIGCSEFDAKQHLSGFALFEAADEALYRAKADGRNCVKAY